MSKNLPVSKIGYSVFNPPMRTSDPALSSLKEDIGKNGILSPVHVILKDGGYELIDGHRRVHVAKELKISHVEAIVHEGVSEDDAVHLWASLNKTSRPVTGKEWLMMWWLAGSKSERSLPRIVKQQIRECMTIFGGREGVKYLVEKNVAPAIVHAINLTNNIIVSKGSVRPVPDKKTIGLWLINHKTSGFIHGTFSRAGSVPIGVVRKLVVRIRNDQPMTLADIASRSAVKAA